MRKRNPVMSQVVLIHFTDFHFDYYSIIPHETKPQVLMLSDESGWFLPWFVPYEHHFGVVNHINQAIKAQLGCNVTVLRCFYENYSLETKTGYRAYAMENHSHQWIPPKNACWLGFEELDNIKFAIPQLRQVLDSWFREIEDNNLTVKRRVPWAKSGWYNQATAWINSQLNLLGISTNISIEQVKSQTRSCLLKVSTNSGKIYFKATFGIFAREPELTSFISQVDLESTPKLLAIDTNQHYMLMLDLNGKHLGEITDISQWEQALRLFAQMQIKAVVQVDKLLNIGFNDRRLERVISQIEILFADKSALLVPQKEPRLSAIEVDKLRSFTTQLIAMYHELAICGIPQTLVHGDFHCGNVMVTDEQLIYFDWSDGAVSHPFFDAVFFLQDITHQLPDITDVQIRLLNAYLEPWKIYMSMEQLLSIFAKAQPLASLYYAVVSYEVTQNIEVSHRWEMEEAVPYWLKILLTQLESMT